MTCIMQYPWRSKFQYPALALFMAAFLLHPFLASAGPLISINPAHVELTATPGAHLTSAFKFWNGTSVDLLVHLQAADFTPQGEGRRANSGGRRGRPHQFSEALG